jgi:hypothetical protein
MKSIGFALVFTVGIINDVGALPSKCLQAPSRVNSCAHIIYKKAALAVKSVDVEKGEVICLCLTDLGALYDPAKSKVAKIDQQLTLELLLQKHQMTEQDILTLLRY